MSQKDRYQKEKKQKSHQLNESKLRWKNHEFVGLRAKTYSYLTNDNDENKKKSKSYKKMYNKKKINLKVMKTICKYLSLSCFAGNVCIRNKQESLTYERLILADIDYITKERIKEATEN